MSTTLTPTETQLIGQLQLMIEYLHTASGDGAYEEQIQNAQAVIDSVRGQAVLRELRRFKIEVYNTLAHVLGNIEAARRPSAHTTSLSWAGYNEGMKLYNRLSADPDVAGDEKL